MMPMKGITCCGDCGFYNWKKHCCTRAKKEGTGKDRFYVDCPLPDVVLKEQDGFKPKLRNLKDYDGHTSRWYNCSACDFPLFIADRFCRYCGTKVKWHAENAAEH